MPEAAREMIHALFADHEKIERKVELTDKGYRATTTSKDPELARKIRTHVAQMETRLDAGYGVRRWDPAFDELRDHYKDMAVTIVEVEGGLSVTVAGKTPEAVKVARNHAQIVSGFVKKGAEQAHETHPIALDGKD